MSEEQNVTSKVEPLEIVAPKKGAQETTNIGDVIQAAGGDLPDSGEGLEYTELTPEDEGIGSEIRRGYRDVTILGDRYRILFPSMLVNEGALEYQARKYKELLFRDVPSMRLLKGQLDHAGIWAEKDDARMEAIGEIMKDLFEKLCIEEAKKRPNKDILAKIRLEIKKNQSELSSLSTIKDLAEQQTLEKRAERFGLYYKMIKCIYAVREDIDDAYEKAEDGKYIKPVWPTIDDFLGDNRQGLIGQLSVECQTLWMGMPSNFLESWQDLINGSSTTS